MDKLVLLLFSVFKFWIIGFIIILPITLIFCKAAKYGDDGNKLVNKSY